MALLREALPTFNANEEGGVFIMTSSTAVSPEFPRALGNCSSKALRSCQGVANQGSSLPYAVTKGAQLRMMKALAASQGPKTRVNAVLPGLLLTEWVCPRNVHARTTADVFAGKEIPTRENTPDGGTCGTEEDSASILLVAKNLY